MIKLIKIPGGLTTPPYNQNSLKLNGMTVVESCTHVLSKTGSMFLEDHLLLFILQGTYTIKYGKQRYTLRKNEMVLLKKAIVIEYVKKGDPANDNLAEYMMFFLKEDFLKEFIQKVNISTIRTDELVPISVKIINKRLLGFIESLKPYFHEPQTIDSGLIKLKMLELLYAIADIDKNLLQQLFQLKKQVRTDISHILETNFMNPVSLPDLAYLSGRSLSSFKRDFKAIYKVPPSKWIRERRLNKAKQLLVSTSLSVTDICYMTGFENIAHFSRAFKEFFGHSPSSQKKLDTVYENKI